MNGPAATCAELGARPELAATWIEGLLRDGFALTVAGDNPDFTTLHVSALVELAGRLVGDGAR